MRSHAETRGTSQKTQESGRILEVTQSPAESRGSPAESRGSPEESYGVPRSPAESVESRGVLRSVTECDEIPPPACYAMPCAALTGGRARLCLAGPLILHR